MAEDKDNAVTTTTNVIVSPTPDVKPGHKTTEFYIHLAVVILSALATVAGIVEGFSKGVLSPSDAMMALGGVATATLSALGYTASRTIVKNAASMLLIAFALTFSGCASAVSKDKVDHLRGSLGHERAAVAAIDSSSTARLPALEKAVDDDLTAIEAGATNELVTKLRRAIVDERAAVQPRSGFEKAVHDLEQAIDDDLDAMEGATK